MKKQFLIFFPILFFFVSEIFSQDLTVNLSEELKLEKGYNFSKHLKSDETGHYLLFYRYKKITPIVKVTNKIFYTLKNYDNSFNEVWSKEFAENEYSNFVNLNGKIYALGNETNNEQKNSKYFVAKVTSEGNIGEKKRIHTQREEQPYSKMVTSDDKSKFAIIHHNENKPKIDKFEYSIHVYDDDFELLWSKNVKTQLTKEKFKWEDILLNNSGSIYFLVKDYEKNIFVEKKKKKGVKGKVAAYKYSIYQNDDQSDEPRILSIDIDDKFVCGATMAIIGEELICGGMYSNTSKFKTKIDGVFCFKFDKKGELIQKGINEFTNNEKLNFKNIEGTTLMTIGKKVGAIYKVRIEPTENGSFVLLADMSKIGVSASSTTTNYFDSFEILLFSISKNLNITDIDYIPKSQNFMESSEDGYNYLSFRNLSFKKNGVLVLFSALNKSFKKGGVMAFSYDESSGVNKQKLGTELEKELIVFNDSFKRVNDDSIFFVAKRPKRVKKGSLMLGLIKIQ